MERVVLITGASTGIGNQTAKLFQAKNWKVAATMRSPEKAEDLQRIVDLKCFKVDVTDAESVRSAIADALKEFGRIDILINNAGIHSDTSFNAIESTDLDDCVTVYDVNAVGPLRVVKSFLPLIAKSEKGLIVNISSESGSISTAVRTKEFDYCMSKAALNMGTKLLHNYLKDKGVNIVTVHPGWMRTDMGGPNADLDPYENAVQLVELFNKIRDDTDGPVFIDNKGREYPW